MGTVTGAFEIDVTLPPPQPQPPGPWRILYGPPQPAGGVTGEIIQAAAKTVTLRTEPDQAHQVDLDINGRDAAAAGITELQTDLIVMFGAQIVFCGRVVPTQDTLGGDAHRETLSAFDYREVLRNRFLLSGDTLSWAGVDQATIAWNLIQATQGRPGGNLGIARGRGQSTGVTRTYNASPGDLVGDHITSLAQLDGGFEWQITPYGMADLRLDVFYPQQGTDRGRVLRWGDGRVSSITRTVDPSTYANAVYVTGDSSKSLTPQQLDAASIAARVEGRWDKVIGTQDGTAATLAADAAAQLNRLQVVTPSYSITCYPGTWSGISDLWLGDYVTVQIDDGRLQVNDRLRIVELSFAIGPDNVETLTLTVGAIPFQLHRAVKKILKRLSKLETR